MLIAYIYIYIIVSVLFEVVELDLSGVVPCCSSPKSVYIYIYI